MDYIRSYVLHNLPNTVLQLLIIAFCPVHILIKAIPIKGSFFYG